jgi:hypothetical protein
MKRRNLGLGLLAGLTLLTGVAAGCSSEGAAEGAHGTLSVPLTTVGASGITYRLRDATFQISSPYSYDAGGAGGDGPQTQIVTVSSEDNVDAASIAVSVERGSYSVRLLPGWRMEKVEGGVASEVEANLLSEATQWLYVNPHATTWVEYRFGLGERAIWFNGKVNIGVQVYENPSEILGGGGFAGQVFGGFSGSP